ncbi:uncharacterized protein LOC126878976 [Diabrotica virgifera virgifera]|uniref:Uncharacterized protein n=1 Tax=Diabrotica virgifera virgifera TaxID=50390 RepID=A0ABM5JIN1_DIAVI|nr:uncharacterized protein LOC126878976 [Diabrotica virgifera virgifera]XP_050497797.1 uncharacterized protein LOC126878976 [Diabrotica virgifera virgifera]XP_050497798.1 uncharacterized protein LOC126878976 [Diabrotica virgifera virgifera]
MDDNQNQEEDRQSGRKEYRQDLNFVNRDINEDNNIVEMEQSDKGENDGEKNGVKSKEKKYQGRPKKGGKRKFPSQNREICKKDCIQNKSYFTQKGEMKLKKEFRQYLCKCDCLSKVGIENAKQEYDKFYEVSSYDAQRALICAMVQEGPIKRKRKQNSTKKMHSRVYNINGHVVCKTFLLQTLRISSAKVDNALKSKKRIEGVKDLRGRAGGKNKISEERLQEILEHIEQFPKYKSHYAREKTSSIYLRADTTLPIMYDLYKQQVNNSPVSFSKYKNVFLTHFNFRRKPLKKDTCNLCDKLEILINNSATEEQVKCKTERDNHIDSAEEARQALNADRKRAKFDEQLEVLCFDMEKTLPLPRIPTNVVFYKRQLWLYNLGIHTAKHNKGHCYVWLEGEAGRGAQEVGSCLFRHVLKARDMEACKHLILWSDSCGGQNRNIKIVLMLNAIFDVHPLLERITLRLLTSGHSFLPNDTDFGDIECALKFQQRMY